MQHLVRAVVLWLAVLSFAAAQTTFEIELNSSRSGVIPTEEIDHIYVLNVPAGLSQLTIRVDAFGDDADMAVYFGDQQEELYYDISTDPYPTFTLDNPRPGRYLIYVKNLLWQPLRYELHVSASGGQVAPPPPPGGPSLTLAVRTASPGQTVEVSFSGAPGYSQDWIGLYREDADDRSYLSWQYIDGLRSGSRTFSAPNEPGRYNFRLFENNGYTRLAVSETFEVRAHVQPPSPPSAAVAIPCERLANESPFAELAEGASITVTCPAGCNPSGRLWGTDIYTNDSQVCLAARHAGVIGEQGGTFIVTMLAGQQRYEASTRHGVASSSWGAWPKSFKVSPVETVIPPQPGLSLSLTVRSDEAAVLRSPEGVVLDIPAGAVPLMADGSIGQMVFSVAPAEVSPVVPSQFALAGPVIQLEPSGLPLEQPIRVTLPLAAGVDPGSVYGVTTFDAAENRWIILPGIVDPLARTVSFMTDHLSPWAPVHWGTEAWDRGNGGYLRITNDKVRGVSDPYRCRRDDPNCKDGLPSSHGYGVCLVDWALENPNLRFWSATDGSSRVASARDGETIRWWLPSGIYTIEEFYHVSQINNDPLYVPRHQMYVRPPRTIQVLAGQTIELGANYPGDYQEGWATCFGGSGVGSTRRRITAVGTGDVQVTLTWQANVDVDLYVTDPSGDTVYYGNTRVASGGELDRDNQCGNFEWGRPENIFWPPGGAPSGQYKVSVRYYGYCGEGEAPSVNWSVRTVVGGVSRTYSGTLAPYESQEVTTFEVR